MHLSMSSDAKQEKMTLNKEQKIDFKTVFFLQLLLAFTSVGGVCSKLAAGEPFLSLKFCLFYGGLIFMLGIYAIAWQQIIKRLPLTFAYANKAIGVIWGMFWGLVAFGESITPKKILGAVIVIAGIVLYSLWGNYEQD